jgi:hypothetical protein
MQAERAAEIGRDALLWLAGEPEALGQFLDASGLRPTDLRARAGDPEFLGFVLEFLLGSDARVTEFAASAGIRPEDAGRARAVLGGELPNWT